MGEKVLLVDFDPQSNLSMSFGIERPDELNMPINNRPLSKPNNAIADGRNEINSKPETSASVAITFR